MRSSEIFSLPIAKQEYNEVNEQTMRRSVEQYISVLRDDVRAIEDQKSGRGSAAIRRHQFLLMGA
jgi:hypothetical protein